MTTSLRLRLTLVTAVATAAALVIASIAIYMAIRSALYSEFDRGLEAKAYGLSALIEWDDQHVVVENDDRMREQFDKSNHPDSFKVWTESGEIIAKSESNDSHDAPIPAASVEHRISDVTLQSGDEGREIVFSFYPHLPPFEKEDADEPGRERSLVAAATPDESRPLVTLRLASSTWQVRDALSQLRWLVAVVSAVAIIAATLLQVAVVQRSMSPLDSLAHQIERVSENDLSHRCGESSLPRELKPIAVKLNELLGRLDAAFMREKSFTSDVAHELRTPVAGMRSTLEVALSAERTAEDYRRSLSDCLAICSDMQRLTESLLALVRIESGQIVVHQEEVDVNALLLDCWQPLGSIARNRDVSVDWRPRGARLVESDSTCLKLILRNLLENAVTYVNPGGRITVESSEIADSICVMILNTGCQIAAVDAPKVFDRFWRGSLAREGTGSHAGLGLAICRRLSDRLRSSIEITSEQHGIFCVCLTVPRQGSACNALSNHSNDAVPSTNGFK